MTKKDWKKECEQLKETLNKTKKNLEDANLWETKFTNMFALSAQKQRKAFDIAVNNMHDNEIQNLFAELHELREYKENIKNEIKLELWLKNNPNKSIKEYIQSLDEE